MAAEKIIYNAHINHYKDPDNGWNVKVVEYEAGGISFPMLTEFFRINLEHGSDSRSVSFEHLMIPIALPEFQNFLANEKKWPEEAVEIACGVLVQLGFSKLDELEVKRAKSESLPFASDVKDECFDLFDQYMLAKTIGTRDVLEVLAFCNLMSNFELLEDYYASRETNCEELKKRIRGIIEECNNNKEEK